MNNNEKSILTMLERQIAQGDLEAKIEWATFYAFEHPEYITNNEIVQKIISYYEEGVAHENATACTNLGAIYYSGILTAQNFTKAAELYTKAAALGDSQALCNLGYCFYYGRDTDIDYAKAFECFLQATLYENPNAAYKLGDMYLDDHYLPKNETMAYTLYQRAYEYLFGTSDTLSADITYRLAKCSFYGIGTQKELFRAYQYIQTSELQYYVKLKQGNDPFAEGLLRKTQALKNKIAEALENELFLPCAKGMLNNTLC